jgi:hypothetical protein
MTKISVPVRLTGKSDVETNLEYEEESFAMSLLVEGRVFQSSGALLIVALSALRRELESASYLICVQGARFDVYPSGLTSQMNGGRFAYVHFRNRRSFRSDLVDILAPALPEEVTTVKAQIASIRSIRKGWPPNGL